MRPEEEPVSASAQALDNSSLNGYTDKQALYAGTQVRQFQGGKIILVGEVGKWGLRAQARAPLKDKAQKCGRAVSPAARSEGAFEMTAVTGQGFEALKSGTIKRQAGIKQRLRRITLTSVLCKDTTSDI